MPGENELGLPYELMHTTCELCSTCEMKGDDVKKWREAIIFVKCNILYVYKNDSAKGPQMMIGLDKCLVQSATVFDERENVLQIKTSTGRIFCFSLPQEENVSKWVTTIKDCDYDTMRENVATLQQNLQMIGLAQDEKAREDREKAKKQQMCIQLEQFMKMRKNKQFVKMLMCIEKWRALTKKQGEESQLREGFQRELKGLKDEQERMVKTSLEEKKQLETVIMEMKRTAGVEHIKGVLERSADARRIITLETWNRKEVMEEQKRILQAVELEKREKEEMMKRVEQMQLQSVEKEKETTSMIEKMKKEREEERAEYANMKKEHTALKNTLDEIAQKCEETENQNVSYKQQIDQLNSSLFVLEEAANSSDDGKQGMIAALQKEVADSKLKLTASQKDEEEYKRKWEMLQEFSVEELARGQKKIDELTATCGELIKQVEEANNGEKVLKMVKEIDALKMEKLQLEESLREMDVQLKATVDVVHNSSTIAIERENEMDTMKKANDALEKELQESIQARQVLEAMLEETKQNLEERLKKSEEAGKEQIARLEEANKKQKDELGQLKRRLLSLKNMEESMQDTEDLLKQRETQLKDVLERIKRAERTSKECREQVAAYKSQNEALERKMAGYTFRESEAGEVIEKIVEKEIDRQETLDKVAGLEKKVEELEDEKLLLKKELEKIEEDERRMEEKREMYKTMKRIPLKFFPIYPSLREDEGKKEVENRIVVDVEKKEMKEPIVNYAGRNPDVERKEEEERLRKEEEERLRREEEERLRREEEERLRREEEERLRREEEERLRREEEERLRREEEERLRKEEEERLRREEEERLRREEEERLRREEEERLREEEEENHASNPFSVADDTISAQEVPESSEAVLPSEEMKPVSPNPFDHSDEESSPVSGANPFGYESSANPFADSNSSDQSNPFAEPNSLDQTNPFAEPNSPDQSNPFAEPNSLDQTNPFAEPNSLDQTPSNASNLFDFSSVLEEKDTDASQPKKSVWKSIGEKGSGFLRNSSYTSSASGTSDDGKKKWSVIGDKAKGEGKKAMGRFSNLMKNAAAKGSSVFKRKSQEPDTFPPFDSSELMEGMKAPCVEQFFKSWNYDESHKRNVHEWIASIVTNQPITPFHVNGLSIEHTTPYVEEAFRNCIVPLLTMRQEIDVDFSEVSEEDGSFSLYLKVSEKPMEEDLLSGFYHCLLNVP